MLALIARELWLAPVELIVWCEDASAEARLTVAVDGGEFKTCHATPRSRPATLKVTATGEKHPEAGQTEVVLAPLRKADWLSPLGWQVSDGWRYEDERQLWFTYPSPEAPTTATWSGVVGAPLLFAFYSSPMCGIAHVSWSAGLEETYDLYAPEHSFRTVELPLRGGPTRYVLRLPDWFDRLSLQVEDGELGQSELAIVWAGYWLHQQPIALDSESAAEVDYTMRPWHLAGYVGWHIVLITVRSLLFIVTCGLVGWFVLLGIGRWLPLSERFSAAVVSGWALLTTLSVALTHNSVTGAQVYWGVVGVAALATAVLLIVPATRRQLLALWRAPRRQWRTCGKLAILAGICVAVLFTPALSNPNWYMGHAYTDTCYNINTSEAFRNYSFEVLERTGWRYTTPLDLLVDATVTPRIRSGDFLAMLNTSLLSFSHGRDIFAQQHINLWLLIPFAMHGFLRRAVRTRAVRCWGTVLISMSAIVFALFSQGYMSQFMLTVSMLYSLQAGTALAGALRRSRPDWGLVAGLHVWFALTLALAIAVYPPQVFASVGFALFMGGWAVWRLSWRPMVHLIIAGTLSALLANWSLLPILHGAAERGKYLESLNSLARDLVFPFYADLLHFLGILFGVVDWVALRRLLLEQAGDIFPQWSGLVTVTVGAATSLARWVGLLMLIGLGIGVVRALLVGRAAQRLWLCVTLAFVAATVAFAVAGQVYLYAKLMTTMGILLVIGVVIGLDGLARVLGRSGEGVIAGLLLVMTGLNVCTVWVDNSVYLTPSPSVLQQQGRTHVDDLRPELVDFDRAYESLNPQHEQVHVVGHFEEGRRTDGDRVVRFHVAHTLRGSRVVWPTNPADAVADEAGWLLVFDGFDHPVLRTQQFESVYRNPLLRLYVRAAAEAQ